MASLQQPKYHLCGCMLEVLESVADYSESDKLSLKNTGWLVVKNGNINSCIYVFDKSSEVNYISMFNRCFRPLKPISFWTWWFCAPCKNVINKSEVDGVYAVSYTHLTLPTILRV